MLLATRFAGSSSRRPARHGLSKPDPPNAASELVSRCARSWFGAEHRSERSRRCVQAKSTRSSSVRSGHPALGFWSILLVNEERGSRAARWRAWAPRRRRGSVDPGLEGARIGRRIWPAQAAHSGTRCPPLLAYERTSARAPVLRHRGLPAPPGRPSSRRPIRAPSKSQGSADHRAA
jgi:hypothetical protein